MYDMQKVIARAGGDGCMQQAVHRVLDHDPPEPLEDNGDPSSSKTLYFAPGGFYRITAPIVIDVAGVVFRGEAGHVHRGADAAMEDWGTVFTCDIPTAADGYGACITVKHWNEGSDAVHRSLHGFRFEGITMSWGGGSLPSGFQLAALRLWGNRFAAIRDSRWHDFPGTSILLVDNNNPIDFENLVFESDLVDLKGEPLSHYAIAAAAVGPIGQHESLPRAFWKLCIADQCWDPLGDVDEECGDKGDTQANNSLHIADVKVSGYWTGVLVQYSTEGTLEDSWFDEPYGNAVVLDSAFGWKVRACRFLKRGVEVPLASSSTSSLSETMSRSPTTQT